MISTSRSTKDWSASQQGPEFKQLEGRSMSVGDEQKALGGKDVGTVLNEIADPNYVDPAKTRKVGKKDLDKDAFFKLMLAQIKYQNPQQPMESHEMAAHLAQFTSLEQLYNVNENLAAMRKTADPAQNFAAVQFIGKSVVADGSQIFRTKGDTSHEVRFNLGAPAQKVSVTIVDSTGKDVRKIQLNNLKQGGNTFAWNGILDDGSSARAGEFNLKFEAEDANAKKVEVETKTSGKVTGVTYTATGPVLLMGKQTLRISDVRRVEDDALAASENARTQSGMPAGMPGATGMPPISGMPSGAGLGAASPALPPLSLSPEAAAAMMNLQPAQPEIIPDESKALPPAPRPKPKLMEPKNMTGNSGSGALPEVTSNLNEIATQGTGVGSPQRSGQANHGARG